MRLPHAEGAAAAHQIAANAIAVDSIAAQCSKVYGIKVHGSKVHGIAAHAIAVRYIAISWQGRLSEKEDDHIAEAAARRLTPGPERRGAAIGQAKIINGETIGRK